MPKAPAKRPSAGAFLVSSGRCHLAGSCSNQTDGRLAGASVLDDFEHFLSGEAAFAGEIVGLNLPVPVEGPL